MPSQFQTKWVDSPSQLPPLGIECPVCGKGIIEDNSFTSKKGIPFKSVSCRKCQVDWVVSQFPKKPQKIEVQTPEEYKEDTEKTHEEILLNLTGITEEELVKRLDNIDTGLVGIRMDIKERLDNMAKYLKEKLG